MWNLYIGWLGGEKDRNQEYVLECFCKRPDKTTRAFIRRVSVGMKRSGWIQRTLCLTWLMTDFK